MARPQRPSMRARVYAASRRGRMHRRCRTESAESGCGGAESVWLCAIRIGGRCLGHATKTKRWLTVSHGRRDGTVYCTVPSRPPFPRPNSAGGPLHATGYGEYGLRTTRLRCRSWSVRQATVEYGLRPVHFQPRPVLEWAVQAENPSWAEVKMNGLWTNSVVGLTGRKNYRYLSAETGVG